MENHSDAGNHHNRDRQHDIHVHQRFPYGCDRKIYAHQRLNLIVHRADGNERSGKLLARELPQTHKQLPIRLPPPSFDQIHHDLFLSGAVFLVLQKVRLVFGQIFHSLRQVVIDLADVNQIILSGNDQIEVPELILIDARRHEGIADIVIFSVLGLRLQILGRRDAADAVSDQMRVGIGVVGVNFDIPLIENLSRDQAYADDQKYPQKSQTADISAGNRPTPCFDFFSIFHSFHHADFS